MKMQFQRSLASNNAKSFALLLILICIIALFSFRSASALHPFNFAKNDTAACIGKLGKGGVVHLVMFQFKGDIKEEDVLDVSIEFM